MRVYFVIRAALEGICLATLLALPSSAAAHSPPSFSRFGREIASDSRWFVDSLHLDVEDIATSPLYVAAPQSPFRSPRFYLALTAAGAIWGTSFALDKTVQNEVWGKWRTARTTSWKI
jgi:hypothetical protein